jgi:hypothetical protein
MRFQFSKIHKSSAIFSIFILSVAIFIFAKLSESQPGNTRSIWPISGDVNIDGKVDMLDFQLFYTSFGKSADQSGYNANADFNGDKRVDILDLQILINSFGNTAASPTPTQVMIATPRVTQNPTPTPLPTIPPEDGMWISKSELLSLPMSGSAWDTMSSTAYKSWGKANLRNQNSDHSFYTLAGALVYARTNDAFLRSKVRDGIIAAKQSFDESSEWRTKNGVLASGRQIGAYVIAADLIDLENYDAAAENEFREWLQIIRTANVGTHGRWKSITYTCENSTGNWSTFACASRIAASIYLGDTADVDRSASIIRAYFGERSFYPEDAPGTDGYFAHTAGYQSSWACNDAAWTGINPACGKSSINIDGALVEDASRGGRCCTLQGDGVQYSWEALQGLFVSTELLYRTGIYGNPYDWSDQALKRAMDHMERSGWGITNPAKYVPWMANARYGTSYPSPPASDGRIMSWGDWLYQK